MLKPLRKTPVLLVPNFGTQKLNFGTQVPNFGTQVPSFGTHVPSFGTAPQKFCTLVTKRWPPRRYFSAGIKS
jgi:hypothetical protein